MVGNLRMQPSKHLWLSSTGLKEETLGFAGKRRRPCKEAKLPFATNKAPDNFATIMDI